MTVTLAYGSCPSVSITIDTVGNLLEFDSTESNNVAVPSWVNQSPDIDNNVWTRKIEEITYVVRLSDLDYKKLRDLQNFHALLTYNDDVFGKVDEQCWINNLEAEYAGDENSALPWKVTLTLVVPI